VSQATTLEALMAKAARACASARALLDLGDVDGACNRAYYAMFDAARAALLASAAPVETHMGKTYSGLIAAFGLYLVKDGPIPRELGPAAQARGRNSIGGGLPGRIYRRRSCGGNGAAGGSLRRGHACLAGKDRFQPGMGHFIPSVPIPLLVVSRTNRFTIQPSFNAKNG